MAAGISVSDSSSNINQYERAVGISTSMTCKWEYQSVWDGNGNINRYKVAVGISGGKQSGLTGFNLVNSSYSFPPFLHTLTSPSLSPPGWPILEASLLNSIWWAECNVEAKHLFIVHTRACALIKYKYWFWGAAWEVDKWGGLVDTLVSHGDNDGPLCDSSGPTMAPRRHADDPRRGALWGGAWPPPTACLSSRTFALSLVLWKIITLKHTIVSAVKLRSSANVAFV